MSADNEKRVAGEAAAALVEDGMTVGLGTGSTAAWFVKALGARIRGEGLSLTGVATSRATEALAAECGVPVIDLDAATNGIDLTVDGADEVGPGLALIKGGGGALLREKLVWSASRRCVVIADAGKVVDRLGAFGLPVEVAAFGHASTARRVAGLLWELGYSGVPVLRKSAGATYATDNGGVIYDLPVGAIAEPQALAEGLKAIVGVVEHGLFLNLAEHALVGGADGVAVLAPDGSRA